MPLRRWRAAALLPIVALVALPGIALSADWPMWRYDARRTASSPDELPADLRLQWVLELPAPEACWPYTQYKLQFDASYEPVVMGNTLFVPSMVRDSVIAYDTDTGEEKWRFYADGPVRFAPVAWRGRLYFVSDDGYLHCLDAGSGKLLWKFRGGPSERKLLGNDRLISTWPARGAPVLYEGTVYFAAGIWPFMGTFIYALDAETGDVVWANSGSGSDFILQPHHSPAFAGVAPQGYMIATEDKLLAPAGRSVPAAYDRKTGRFLYWRADTKLGGYRVYLAGDVFINDGHAYKVEDGGELATVRASVMTDDAMIGIDGEGRIVARSPTPTWREHVDKRGKKIKRAEFPTLWQLKTDRPFDRVFMRAGARLYCGAKGLVAAVDIPATPADAEAAPSWQADIEGEPWEMLAADRKLFVVTREGRIYCFGARQTAARTLARPTPKAVHSDDEWAGRAKQILRTTGVREGYCLVLGVRTGRLAEELASQSDLRVIGLGPDASRMDALRRQLDEAGIYGKRISLLPGDPASVPMSPYLASLVVAEDLKAAGLGGDDASLERVFRVLRPYGGVACLSVPGGRRDAFVKRAKAQRPEGAAVRQEGGFVMLQRPGALPGSADWTHQYGDVANTVCSMDDLVKPPLALLWFGGPSNADVLPRHGHGPCEQVAGGRLFIEGIHVLSARDVYTGRVLWRKELPDLDTFDMYYNKTYKPDPYDRSYNQVHIPGANAYGSNFVVGDDRVYVAQGQDCLVLDAATGETLQTLKLPAKPGEAPPNWGYIGVYQDLLIAGASPLRVAGKGDNVLVEPNSRFGEGSKRIVVMDRSTGKVLWEREAAFNFRHNTIVAGKGKLFCIDHMSDARLDRLKRRGIEPEGQPKILALDIRTGDVAWEVGENVFGTWLGYSEERDILLQAGSRAGDRAPDEVGAGMAAYRGADGNLIWKSDRRYSGPPILYHDWIITQTGGGDQQAPPAPAFSLLTGEPISSTHPLTGETIPWAWVRFKGCNTAVASQHLLTFRSASAAYAQLPLGGGTASIGGFKSGCTSNLVVADGVLNAPDYTRTCTCSYQNQTSLALVYAPEGDPDSPDVEGWSFDYFPSPDKPTPVKRVGINFGAPGNRLARDGTLWLEFPSVGGPSPDIPVYVEGDDPRIFRYHMSRLKRPADEKARGVLNWVAASGIEGVRAVTIRLFLQPADPDANKVVKAFEKHPGANGLPESPPAAVGGYEAPRPYTVRLHFAEVQDLRPGERVFDVTIQGEEVLKSFDIVAAAGGPNRAVVKEFRDILVKDDLKLSMKPSRPGMAHGPLLCGIEIQAQR